MVYELQSGQRFDREIAAPMPFEEMSQEMLEPRESGETKVPNHQPTAVQKEGTSAEGQGPSLEIQRYRKKQMSYGGTKLIKESDGPAGEENSKDLSEKHVLKVIREFDPNKAFWRTCIEIFSPNLQAFLDRVPGFTAKLRATDDTYNLTEPFIDIFLNRKVLTEAIEDQDVGSKETDLIQARSHVQLVLDFLRNDYADISRKLDDLESDTPSGAVTYPELWLLYKPGTIVYTLENGEYEAFVVDSIRGMNKRQKSTATRFSHGRLDLTCWSIDYDGEAFGRVWSMHCLAPFHGSRDITSLDLIPEKFLPNPAEVKQSLLNRGKLFWALQGQQCREYTGELYSQHTKEEATRVMIDHLTYQRRNNWPISINRKRGPAHALSKNWKDNRFGRNSDGFEDEYCCRKRRLGPAPPPNEDIMDDDWDDLHGGRERPWDPYKRYTFEYPPLPLVAKYETFDLIEGSAQPDDLALLVCPQCVHGYCLREKIWSKITPTITDVFATRPIRLTKSQKTSTSISSAL